MKSLIITLAMTFSLSVSASVTKTLGATIKTPILTTLQMSFASVALTGGALYSKSDVVLSATTEATSKKERKAIAEAIVSEAQEYLQTGEMSVLLSYPVNALLAQDSELSVEDAVSLVLENIDLITE